MSERPDSQTKRNPILAGALSLVLPGVGQIYAGSVRRGLTLLIGLPVQAALFYGVGLNGLIYWMAAVWAWNVFDAVMLARNRHISAFGPILLILALNIVAAGRVTDVQIPRLQPQQKSVIGKIAGGMAKPDLVTPKSASQIANARYIVPGPGAPESVQPRTAKLGVPSITLTPQTAAKGAPVRVRGQAFTPGAEGGLILLGAEEAQVADFRADRNGRFDVSFVNPRSIPGDYYIQARAVIAGQGYELSEALRTAAPRMLETVYLALLGTVISLVFAIPLSFFGARNLMSGSAPLRLVYAITRAIFTVLRSVEVLIFAVIAVAAVGIGPFAGVIALAIHGIGALGKLYSESIESIEHGPIEAVRATGANEFQVVLYGVVPQVVPQFIAFTLYRWDINVRMATVIGLVGGGGIGYQLIQYMNLSQWPQAATAIWMIAGVVMIMDYASAVIREKVI